MEKRSIISNIKENIKSNYKGFLVALVFLSGVQLMKVEYNSGRNLSPLYKYATYYGNDFLTTSIWALPFSVLSQAPIIPSATVAASVVGIAQEVYQCTPPKDRIVDFPPFNGVCDTNDYFAISAGYFCFVTEKFLQRRRRRRKQLV